MSYFTIRGIVLLLTMRKNMVSGQVVDVDIDINFALFYFLCWCLGLKKAWGLRHDAVTCPPSSIYFPLLQTHVHSDQREQGEKEKKKLGA